VTFHYEIKPAINISIVAKEKPLCNSNKIGVINEKHMIGKNDFLKKE